MRELKKLIKHNKKALEEAKRIEQQHRHELKELRSEISRMNRDWNAVHTKLVEIHSGDLDPDKLASVIQFVYNGGSA